GRRECPCRSASGVPGSGSSASRSLVYAWEGMAMDADASFWKRCSTCKKELPFAGMYWACNVSTCNRPRTALVFCSVSCWDAHVPMLRHRDAWAEERRSPTAAEWAREQREAERKERRRAERARRGSSS